MEKPNKVRFFCLFGITAFVLFLANTRWHIINGSIKDISAVIGLLLALVVGTGAAAVGMALFTFIALPIILKFSPFFLGYGHQDNDERESDKAFYYATAAMFAFGLCSIFFEFQAHPQYDYEKNMKKLCNLLEKNTNEEIQDICFPPENPDPE